MYSQGRILEDSGSPQNGGLCLMRFSFFLTSQFKTHYNENRRFYKNHNIPMKISLVYS